jgi:hypothetical protein
MVITISIDPGNPGNTSVRQTKSPKSPPSSKRPRPPKSLFGSAQAPNNSEESSSNSNESSKSDASSSEDEWQHSIYPDSLAPSNSRSRARKPKSGRFVSKSRPSIDKSSKNAAVQTVNIQPLSDADLSGHQEKDFTMHFDLDIGLDVNADIEELSRLNQLGHFNEAILLFHERLASHVDFFPVTAEYVDLLLEQGSFRDAEAFITARLNDMVATFSQV